jgi:hypothetical protein
LEIPSSVAFTKLPPRVSIKIYIAGTNYWYKQYTGFLKIDAEVNVGSLLYKSTLLETGICYTYIEMKVGTRLSRGNNVEVKIDAYKDVWFQCRGGLSSRDALLERRNEKPS